MVKRKWRKAEVMESGPKLISQITVSAENKIRVFPYRLSSKKQRQNGSMLWLVECQESRKYKKRSNDGFCAITVSRRLRRWRATSGVASASYGLFRKRWARSRSRPDPASKVPSTNARVASCWP